jgi:outer membrane protein assembly factor BamB/orotate phosphoribosyltransferase
VDFRAILTDGLVLDAVAELFWKHCQQYLPFQIGGIEVAAIPLISAILMKSVSRGAPITGFIIRKERKLYGLGNLIEGPVTDLPIVIVDDLMNSGQSFEKVKAVLQSVDRVMARGFVILDFEAPAGKQWRADNALPIDSLFKLTEFGLSKTPANSARAPPKPIFQEAWNFISPDPNFYNRVPKSFPATDDERVYFGSDCGTFWALNAADGAVDWTFQVHTRHHKNIWSAPALHGGKVYFGGYDGNVYCLDCATGKEIWRFTGADWVGSSPALAPDLGLLFIGLEFALDGQRGAIAALDLQTGELVWKHMTRRYTHASPAYWAEKGLVACGSNDDELFLLEAKTGRVLWRFQTRGDGRKGSIRHAPAFDKTRGRIVTGCADGYIYVIDLETGEEVWSHKTGDEIYTVPLVEGDMAYLGSTDKHFYVIDLEKLEVHTRMHTATKIYGPPRLIEGFVYFGACDGAIHKIDPRSISIAGRYQLADGITNAIAYSAKHKLYYVLTYTNRLYALRAAAV